MNDTPSSHAEILARGQAALQRDDHLAARECFSKVLAANPGSVPAAIGLGLAQSISGDYDSAIAVLQELDRHHPGQGSIMDALGVANATAARFDAAETWFRKSIRIAGFQSARVCNLGMALNELGRFDEAAAMFKRCLRRDPGNDSARYHLGLCRLLAGDYRDGWQGFELRNRVAGRADPALDSIPRWAGEPLEGREIVLLAEQGLGDTLQFARFAGPLADAGATVHIRCQEALHGLLVSIEGVSRVSSSKDPAPDADYQLPLLSAPGMLGTTLESIPSAAGYLSADPALVRKWGDAFGASHGTRRIGLVWAGNPGNKTDYKRSIPLDVFAPLLDMPGCSFFSLQVGDAAMELEALDTAVRPVPLFSEKRPLTEVAAAISSLDLLITVDTSLAHLAGALGWPVWTAITFVPDWRWGLGRPDTPWYDSMQLFRQPDIGNWPGVVSALRDALAETV